ncbi:HNH endonuclease [Mesorhizobium sp. CA4]|uniref:HNH endonuclease n=1 Tax=Mesorhizobium sp. CA4 TaxID=588499 RepID=UPI001CD18F06|nr:hypothetical protein [Mesorhizobium sp. CA4]MBZ9822999.1 hypothetical protein [Mesorhizobium sp. CA4]
MRRLILPAYSARNVVNQCAKSIQDKDLSARLEHIGEQIEKAEITYRQHGTAETLFTIAQSTSVGAMTIEDMKRVYKGTFVKSKGTRYIYDAIKKLPPNDICPMCGQRTVGTLDHYLAQSHHAAFVITPANLVPACGDCNKAKLDAQPTGADQQTLHPYFDNVDDELWLCAIVEERSPAALLYTPDPPPHWPETMKKRLRLHFQKFGLGALYASHSAVELTNIRYGLQRIAERGTTDDIRAELIRRAESSWAANINSWQTAMYIALANSDWFCGGGY